MSGAKDAKALVPAKEKGAKGAGKRKKKKKKGKKKARAAKSTKPRVRKRDIVSQFLWDALRSPNRKAQRKAVRHVIAFAAVTAGAYFFGNKLEIH